MEIIMGNSVGQYQVCDTGYKPVKYRRIKSDCVSTQGKISHIGAVKYLHLDFWYGNQNYQCLGFPRIGIEQTIEKIIFPKHVSSYYLPGKGIILPLEQMKLELG